MPTATRRPKLPHPDLDRILVSKAAIKDRLKKLGAEINKVYGDEELTVIAVVNGAVFFTADLLRHVKTPIRLDCIRVSSYRNSTRPVGPPRILDSLQQIGRAHV